MKPKQIFPGIYRIGKNIATENSVPGFRVYDEKLVKSKKKEYRLWDPQRSKLAAAILKGLNKTPFNQKSDVLYLGASSGTTASHLADICPQGAIYCVEFSKRMMQELLPVSMRKKNMIPILGDAKKPTQYIHQIAGVDVIYQDVAQKNQSEILINNSKYFKPRYAVLSIKSRSINAVESPKKVFKRETNELKKEFNILQEIDLRPYDKDHILISLERR